MQIKNRIIFNLDIFFNLSSIIISHLLSIFQISLDWKIDIPKYPFSPVFQYLYNLDDCFKEVYRVLKPGGYFVVAQRNIYSLGNLTTFRGLLRSILTFTFREEYELFPSYKSMLVDSKLGVLFGRFKDSKCFNSKIT